MPKMLTVYTLRQELENDPEGLKLTQQVSLDRKKDWVGLSARLGLYGTEDWWRNVESGAIPRAHYNGIIAETYYAGMDTDRRHNSFRMKTDEGRDFSWGMVPEGSSYKGLYRPGHRAKIVTIFQELKRRNPDGTPQIMECPLEIRLSTKPVVEVG